jgi:hypothetical protein
MSRGEAARAARWRGTQAERFWARVEKTDTCWLWMGGLRRRGYGAAWHNGRQRSAHQVAWEMENGPIPPGLHLLHTVCDNPRCVRPSHLKLGTNKENHAERVTKGRSSKHGRFARIAHREGVRIAELAEARQ